jgi:hypothetical protein
VSDEEILRLLPITAAVVAVRDDRADEHLARLGAYDERDQAQVDRCLQAFLTGLLRTTWERGWTPADVAQHGRRSLDPGVEPLLLAANIKVTLGDNRMRVSPSVYNDMGDIEKLLRVLPRA